MKLFVFLVFIAAGLFFIYIDQALLAGLCLLAGLFAGIAWFLSGSYRASKSVVSGMTKGIPEQVSKADTGYPDSGILEESVKNAAGLTGQQMFAGRKKQPYRGDQHQFKFKGLGSVGEACQRLIDSFKKVFK